MLTAQPQLSLLVFFRAEKNREKSAVAWSAEPTRLFRRNRADKKKTLPLESRVDNKRKLYCRKFTYVPLTVSQHRFKRSCGSNITALELRNTTRMPKVCQHSDLMYRICIGEIVTGSHWRSKNAAVGRGHTTIGPEQAPA